MRHHNVAKRKLDCRSPATTTDIKSLDWVVLEASGELVMLGVQPPLQSFVPQAEGKPVLQDCQLLDAEYRGLMLAVLVRGPGSSGPVTLRLYRGPDGVALAEYTSKRAGVGFALSRDGKLLARQIAVGGSVEVRATEGDARPILTTFAGRYSADTQFLLGHLWLLLRQGQRLNLLHWDSGRLQIWYSDLRPNLQPHGLSLNDPVVLRLLKSKSLMISAVPAHHGLQEQWKCEKTRFRQGAKLCVTAVVDRFGQIAILDNQAKLICMFFAFRGAVSGWMPDGTCFGPASQSGREPTSEELSRFGAALLEATKRGREIAVKVAFHLRRRAEAAPAAALLLLSHDTAKLLQVCERLGADPLPPVYRVADGFLIKLAGPIAGPVGGVVRLRCLADNLYLPIDADLVPALLPEEAADLGRSAAWSGSRLIVSWNLIRMNRCRSPP